MRRRIPRWRAAGQNIGAAMVFVAYWLPWATIAGATRTGASIASLVPGYRDWDLLVSAPLLFTIECIPLLSLPILLIFSLARGETGRFLPIAAGAFALGAVSFLGIEWSRRHYAFEPRFGLLMTTLGGLILLVSALPRLLIDRHTRLSDEAPDSGKSSIAGAQVAASVVLAVAWFAPWMNENFNFIWHGYDWARLHTDWICYDCYDVYNPYVRAHARALPLLDCLCCITALLRTSRRDFLTLLCGAANTGLVAYIVYPVGWRWDLLISQWVHPAFVITGILGMFLLADGGFRLSSSLRSTTSTRPHERSG